jgi:UDP-N-acetylglucosamine 3-dehydrogenase
MEKALRVGVIGVGQMGLHHARIYQKLPHVELGAICEWDDERRERVGKDLGCTTHKEYTDLLADPTIDAVSIVLPDNMHRDAVEAAVRAGKHILLEKPLAKDLADGQAMYELVKDYDKVFTVGFLLRYDYRFAAIKQALDDGELGDIIHLYARRNSPIIGPRRYIGASDLSMHVMIHDIDYINWYMGSAPSKVFARGRSVLLAEYGMKDVIYALLTYPNGAIACLEACWVLPENSPTMIDDKLELVGTKGVAYVDSCDQGVKFVSETIRYPDSRHWFDIRGVPGGDLSEEILAFVNDILNGTKSIITPQEALDSLRVVDAIERSMAAGTEVEL